MPLLVIPTTGEFPEYTQRSELDGREFVLRFLFSEREERWYLDISDQDEVPLAQGIKLVADFDLLRKQTSELLPPGELYAVDLSGGEDDPLSLLQISSDPGLRDLGARVSLVYFDEAEVAILSAT